MKKILTASALAGTMIFAGCTTTNSIAISDYKGSGNKVTSSVSNFNLLNIKPMSLETSSSALTSLHNQCDGKGVSGVTTMTSSRFLFIGVNEQIQASGYCK